MAEFARDRLRLLVKTDNARAPFERRPIDPAGQLEARAVQLRPQRTQRILDARDIGGRRDPDVDRRAGFAGDDVGRASRPKSPRRWC